MPWKKAPAPPPEAEISAPFNPHIRSGEGPVEPMQPIDADLRPDEETFRPGDPSLSVYARNEAAGGGGPARGGVPEGDQQDGAERDGDGREGGEREGGEQDGGAPAAIDIPTTEELGENDILFPSPSVDDIELPTKQQADDLPVGVISAYRHYAGEFLKHAQRHDIKIERYARYFEADFAAVAQAKEEYVAAEQAENTERQDELTKDMGGNPVGEYHMAAERLQRAHTAEAAADREIPLVDGIYEQARDVERQHLPAAKGGGSIPNATLKLRSLAAQADGGGLSEKKQAKIERQLAAARTKQGALLRARDESGRLGKLVKQAKLSEDALRVKRAGLKHDKQTVKKVKGRGVKLGAHLGKKALATAGSALLSTATLGVFSYTQEKTDGGYSSEKRATPIWVRAKDEMRRIRETAAKRPYGKVTSLHLALEGFGYIVKELRNILMSAALIAIGVSLIPGAAAIAGPIAGFCSTMAIALAALKLLIDAILASWSIIERARNSNARNSDLLTAQAARQGTDVLADAIAVGMAYGGAEIGNAVSDRSTDPFVAPHERFTEEGFSSTTGESLTPLESGNDRAAMAANVGSRQGAKAVGDGVREAAFVEPVASTSLQVTKMKHLRDGRRGADLPEGEAPAAADPASEPAWLKQAKEDEAEARRSSMDALITVHASKIKRFNSKTQTAMTTAARLAGAAPGLGDAEQEGEAQQQVDREEDARAVGGMAQALRDALADMSQLGNEVDNDQLRAHAFA